MSIPTTSCYIGWIVDFDSTCRIIGNEFEYSLIVIELHSCIRHLAVATAGTKSNVCHHFSQQILSFISHSLNNKTVAHQLLAIILKSESVIPAKINPNAYTFLQLYWKTTQINHLLHLQSQSIQKLPNNQLPRTNTSQTFDWIQILPTIFDRPQEKRYSFTVNYQIRL